MPDTPTYEWTGWVGPWNEREKWRGPVTDKSTLVNLWQLAERTCDSRSCIAGERIQVRHA